MADKVFVAPDLLSGGKWWSVFYAESLHYSGFPLPVLYKDRDRGFIRARSKSVVTRVARLLGHEVVQRPNDRVYGH